MTRLAVLALAVVMALAAVASTPAGRPGRWDAVVEGASAPAVSAELGVARAADGTLNVAWQENSSTVRVRPITPAGALGSTTTIVSGYELGADPTLLAEPGGLRAFFAAVTPIEGMLTSSAPAAGGPWSTPTLVESSEFARGRTAGVTTTPDGTPIQTWYSAGDIVVHRGLAPGGVQQLTAGGTNTRPNIVTDASGSVFVAWCEFTGAVRGVFVQRIDPASGAPVGSAIKLPGSTTEALGSPQAACVLESTVSRREPIVARTGGDVFVAGTSGYPALNRVLVWRLDGSGQLETTLVAAGAASASFAEPALAAAPDGRIWVAWLQRSGASLRVVARRSNRAGTAFGAPVGGTPPGGISVGTVNLSAQAGRVDVLAVVTRTNGTRALLHTQFLPGLTLVVRRAVRGAAGTRVTFAVLDAGEPVSGARVRAGGRSAVTGARGTVTITVRRSGTATASRAGYVAASARFRR